MKRQITLEYNKYTPVSSGSSYLIYQYESISSFIKANLKSYLHGILLKPVKRNNGIDYFSEDNSTYKDLSSYSDQVQIEILKTYNAYIYEIERKCKALDQGLELDDHRWASMLRLAFDMDTSIILTDGRNIRLAWGLKFYNKAKYILPFEAFSSRIPNDPVPATETLNVVDQSSAVPEPEISSELDSAQIHDPISSEPTILSTKTEENEFPTEEYQPIPDDPSPIIPPPIIPPEPPKPNGFIRALNSMEAFFKRYWWLLLILFLLLALIYWYFDKKKNDEGLSASEMKPEEVERIYREIMPPKAGDRIHPIEEEEIIDDDQSKVRIVGNVINIALKKKTDNFQHFAVDLKRMFPDTAYQIVYFDDSTRRLQFEFPEDQRVSIKSEIRSKLNPYDLLIWDEAIFRTGRIPNDPSFTELDQSWPLFMINAPQAWDITIGSQSVVVAVIDGGFDLEHQDLRDRYVSPYNVVNKNTAITYGPEGHGTHVAGLIAASGNNRVGSAGVAPGCRLMPIQAVADGVEFFAMTDIIDGILYAIKNNANVINLSLGKMFSEAVSDLTDEQIEQIRTQYGVDEAQFWDELFKMAEDNNVTIVLAAGNENIPTGLDPMQRSEKTIKVAAVNQQRQKADFSNFFTTVPSDGTCLSAPGKGIYSAIPGNQFGYMDGTSMACPIVAGAVALIKSIRPDIRNSQLFSLLYSTGLPLNDPSLGPLIQIDRALTRLRSGF